MTEKMFQVGSRVLIKGFPFTGHTGKIIRQERFLFRTIWLVELDQPSILGKKLFKGHERELDHAPENEDHLCGSSQSDPSNPSQEKNGIKKYVFIVLAIAIIAILFDDKDSNQKSEPLQSASKQQNNEIPGLMPVDIYGNFISKGFEKNGPNKLDNGVLMWTLKKDSNTNYFQVDIFSTNAASVYKISATALDYGTRIGPKPGTNVISFLQHVGSAPYEGADPNYSIKWVKDNINSNESHIIIGNVGFTIYAKGNSRILELEKVVQPD